ncbi:MAG: helix-turn-helix domain-containing protein [Chloroflexota bacterium]
MYKSSITIEDIYRLALPAGTTLLAGEEFISRSVSWACSLRPSPPAFPKLDGNELALIDLDDLRRLDPKMRLDRVVLSLQSARISAIAVLGEVSNVAMNAARTSSLALFQLPETTSLVQVERQVIRLIVDRDGYIAQRSADLQRELNQIALDGGGFHKIAHHIYAFTQQPFIFLREDGQIAASEGLGDLPKNRQQALLNNLPNMTTLRSWAATQSQTDLSKAMGVLPLNSPIGATGTSSNPVKQSGAEGVEYPQTVVAPIYANDAVRGYCLLLRPASNTIKHDNRNEIEDVTAVEGIAALQASAAAALEWAKQNAVDVAEERMRATFVDELLASEIADEQAWIQRGTSLGYDLRQPHVAIIVVAENVPDWPAPLLRFVEEQGINAPYSKRTEGILLFWPIQNEKSGRELKTIAQTFVSRMQSTVPNATLTIGIGRPGVGPAYWLQSQQQARESWRMGKEWKTASVTYFGDLGLYQLLTALGDNHEATRFYRRTLGRLITHDEEHNGELVGTLEGFFVCHGNLSQTANRLHIHRNTLTYRLDRISTITRLDLNDPDARFSLQFALKLRPVMKDFRSV